MLRAAGANPTFADVPHDYVRRNDHSEYHVIFTRHLISFDGKQRRMRSIVYQDRVTVVVPTRRDIKQVTNAEAEEADERGIPRWWVPAFFKDSVVNDWQRQ